MAGIYFYLYLKTQIRKDRFIGPALILKFEHPENNLIGYQFLLGVGVQSYYFHTHKNNSKFKKKTKNL